MKKNLLLKTAAAFCATALSLAPASAQVGHRFPSEKKVVIDPVTGTPLTFLTSSPAGDSKIYQTHPDWTSDGQWVIFRSNRVPGQVMAVNEATGDIVQVTEKGYMGMLCVARKSMKLYFMRDLGAPARRARGEPGGYQDPALANTPPPPEGARAGGPAGPAGEGRRKGGFMRPRGPFAIVEVDLARLFADSAAGTMGPSDSYERICGTMPEGMGAGGNMGLDANEDYVYFSVQGGDVGKDMDPNNPIYSQYVEPGTNHAKPFGPRGMGGGPSGLRSMNLTTGEVKMIVDVPFQIGHVQTNPWVPGEIVFCWETGGKAPQRTWVVKSDGTGLRPLYPEATYEWITHEAVITKDEVAIAILYTHTPGGGGRRGRRGPPAGQTDQPGAVAVPTADAHAQPPPTWGIAGDDSHPTGVGIVNLRTHEMRIVGQLPLGSSGRSIWHVNGSADGRWAAADDFQYRLWIIDRHTGEMALLASMGQVTTAADHIHPTFSADGTKIEIQSAMLSANKHSLNICVVPLPKAWLDRTYDDKNRLLAQ
jgi:oligogalacturonide lyase